VVLTVRTFRRSSNVLEVTWVEVTGICSSTEVTGTVDLGESSKGGPAGLEVELGPTRDVGKLNLGSVAAGVELWWSVAPRVVAKVIGATGEDSTGTERTEGS
jgi:hypothetical protein